MLFDFRTPSRWGTAIHMFGMRYDLAVVWLSAEGRVVDVRWARRWRSLLVPRAAARYVLELPVSWREAFHLGDEVIWHETSAVA